MAHFEAKEAEPEDTEMAPADETEETITLSKRKQRHAARMTVGELKQYVARPDLVEPWDITAHDPLFLIWIKQIPNSIPVPAHWNQKRKFLQYKRGLHKPPFRLPEYIENTGIGRARELTSNAGMSLRQRMKERMRPRVGKVDIDY